MELLDTIRAAGDRLPTKESRMRHVLVLVLSAALAAGSASAQSFEAGLAAYDRGDYEAAIKEWQPLADQGDASAQFNLGLVFGEGQGVPTDYAEAARLYRLAAAQGHAKAQFNLGLMFNEGQGVQQDFSEAARWYRSAAAKGHASAQNNLGRLYKIGRGVPQNYIAAHMWLNIACALDGENGCGNREDVAKKMTPADISEAQRRARICMESKYQNCD